MVLLCDLTRGICVDVEVGVERFSWTPLIFVCFSIYMLNCISFVDFCSYYGYWFVFAQVYVYSC